MKRKSLLGGALVTVVMLAALAGGGYAIFSDNIASDDQEFLAGDVDIVVEWDGQEYEEYFNTVLDMENMEPGDKSTQIVRVRNKGSLPVDLWNWIYTFNDDLSKPNIFACDPNDDCNMFVQKTLVDQAMGPDEKLYPDCEHVKMVNPEPGVNCVIGGDWEDYELRAEFPLCAGNLCQNAFGKVRIFFHAVQQSNLEGWECVKLLYKSESTGWLPDPYWDPENNGLNHGNKCYEASVGEGPDVDFVVNGYNLTPDMPLQIMLNGPGGCTAEDKIIAGDTNNDGVSESCDLYYRAFWNGTPTGGAMSCTCDPNTSGEGVYAIAYGGDYGTNPDPAAKTDADGNFSGQWTAELDACAIYGTGTHTLQTKFLVKQDASPWLEELDELDYQYITFTCP
jgi:hypothetical protein